jgi:DNA ligase-1
MSKVTDCVEVQDLNVGGSMVSAAITDVTGTQRTKIKEMYNAMGDLGIRDNLHSLMCISCGIFDCDIKVVGLSGDVAQTCRQTQSLLVAPQILTIQQVYSTLLRIRLLYY